MLFSRSLRSFYCALLSIALLIVPFSSYALWESSNQNSTNTFGQSEPKFVAVDDAFPFSFITEDHQVRINWQVRDDYYLYQSRFSVTAENAEIGPLILKDGTPYNDEFFGEVNIYTKPVDITVPIISKASTDARLKVQYQGCAKAGFCYPPETKFITLDSSRSTANDAPKEASSQPINLSQESQFASQLENFWWTPLLFVALGIGLAFTPCVLPMYPILTSIVLGRDNLTPRKAFSLSFVYVQGMALTYTLLGLVVASAGVQFQAALQHPIVLVSLSVLFVALALSMFGLYTLQLPSSLQTKLNEWSNSQKGGSLGGVFVMGAISGLVCSPCTTAPLSGALLYVAQSGDLLTGAITLYALGLGMGIPLIIVALFGNKILPKSGEWMNKVKFFFGFVLLAAPIFLLERIIPQLWSTILWSSLGVALFGWLYHLKNQLPFGGWKQSMVGIIAFLGLFASIQPLLNYWYFDSESTAQQNSHVEFIQVSSVTELQQQLSLAKQSNKAVMLDFYADWCVACKEFEKYTFPVPEVSKQLNQMVLLQADVTSNGRDDIALLTELDVLGLPTLEFWDNKGNHLPQARVTGFMKAEPFATHLARHIKSE
jgi:thiol:disulfide interchange protein DsbD